MFIGNSHNQYNQFTQSHPHASTIGDYSNVTSPFLFYAIQTPRNPCMKVPYLIQSCFKSTERYFEEIQYDMDHRFTELAQLPESMVVNNRRYYHSYNDLHDSLNNFCSSSYFQEECGYTEISLEDYMKHAQFIKNREIGEKGENW